MRRPLRRKILQQLQTPLTEGQRQQKRRHRRDESGAWGALVFVFVVLTICVSPNLFQHIPTGTVGKPWAYANVVTPYPLTVEDPEASEIQRRRIQADHAKIFRINRRLEAETNGRAARVMTMLADAPASAPAELLRSEVQRKLGVDLQPATISTLRSQSHTSRTLQDLATVFHHLLEVRGVSADKSLLDSAMRKDRALVLSQDSAPITTSTIRQVLGYPGEAFDYVENAYLQTFKLQPDVRAAYADVVRQLLEPNIVHDRIATEERLLASMGAISVNREIKPGTVVAHNGENLTGLQAQALEQLEAKERQNDILRVIGGSIVVLMAMLFTLLYAGRFNRELHFNSRNILMVALPVVFAVSLGRVILNLGGGLLLGAFAMPAGMVGILTVMLFDERFAIVLTTMACALFAVSTGLNYPYILIGLVGGYTAIASLRNLQERREVLYTGVYVALANCLMALAVGLIMNPARPELHAGLVAALVNGLVCYMLAMAALPIFENIFQITTDVLLLELTSGNHKLLQMMEEKAPGSFHHSLSVASLAEAAAEAVGAHYLLVRAGAYFHDIGKMIKPGYFTENQSTPEQKQIHSRLSPAMSTLIIKNHVKEGVELAREYRLPERVIDFIPEHHGTTLIKYFYVQALKKAEQEGSDETISEEEFRYPGPKPRSVETAILMLADSVEAIATSRFAGKTPDETEIRRAVHEAVTEKYEDKQLSNSPLTFKDLEIIKEAFVRTLQNRFHQRVKYPTAPKPAPATRPQPVAKKQEKPEAPPAAAATAKQ